jgi:hypothetical protein
MRKFVAVDTWNMTDTVTVRELIHDERTGSPLAALEATRFSQAIRFVPPSKF